jgi:alkylated DNA repair dioxygenase AlkB
MAIREPTTSIRTGVQAPPWIPGLLSLKQRVEAATPIAAYKNLLLPAEGYNAVLCNLYRDGSNSVGVHADTLPGRSGRRSTDSIARLAALPAY